MVIPRALLFGSLIDVVVTNAAASPFGEQDLGDSSGQSGLTVVNVTDGADVTWGLVLSNFAFAIVISSYELKFLAIDSSDFLSILQFEKMRCSSNRFIVAWCGW